MEEVSEGFKSKVVDFVRQCLSDLASKYQVRYLPMEGGYCRAKIKVFDGYEGEWCIELCEGEEGSLYIDAQNEVHVPVNRENLFFYAWHMAAGMLQAQRSVTKELAAELKEARLLGAPHSSLRVMDDCEVTPVSHKPSCALLGPMGDVMMRVTRTCDCREG